MQPTLNPKNSKFQDYVLIRDFDNFEVLKESCGSIIFALRKPGLISVWQTAILIPPHIVSSLSIIEKGFQKSV